MRTTSRQVTIKKAAKLLEKNGYVRQPGRNTSHIQFVNSLTNVKITIPGHGGDIAPYLWSSIVKRYSLVGW